MSIPRSRGVGVLLTLLLGGAVLVFVLLSLHRTDPDIRAVAESAKHSPANGEAGSLADPYMAKIRLALTYMESGPPMAGIRLLVKLQKEVPQRYEAPYQLGVMAMNTGQYAKASGWFARAAMAARGASKAYTLINWSDALVLTDKKDSARIILQEVSNYSNDSLLLRSVNEKLNALK